MNKLNCLLLALTVTAATTLPAQTAPADSPRGPRRGGPDGAGEFGGPRGPGGPGGHRGPGRMFPGMSINRALDTDKDGELSAAEIAGASASLRTLDANNDGAITRDELHPGRPGRPADAPPPPADAPARRQDGIRPVLPVMLALDADSDGTLSAGEIANAPASLKALDVNGDGKLSRDELRPLPPVE